MVTGGGQRNGYFGSKATAGLWQSLIAMMPPHDVYIESHLGGGAIMQRKPPALRNIGIDLDGRVIESFRCDYPVELVHGCAHRLLAGFPFRGRELVYADPPYLHEVRRGAQTLPLRIRAVRPRGPARSTQGAGLPGHALRLPLDAL